MRDLHAFREEDDEDDYSDLKFTGAVHIHMP
jgi:hypothetical protein